MYSTDLRGQWPYLALSKCEVLLQDRTATEPKLIPDEELRIIDRFNYLERKAGH